MPPHGQRQVFASVNHSHRQHVSVPIQRKGGSLAGKGWQGLRLLGWEALYDSHRVCIDGKITDRVVAHIFRSTERRQSVHTRATSSLGGVNLLHQDEMLGDRAKYIYTPPNRQGRTKVVQLSAPPPKRAARHARFNIDPVQPTRQIPDCVAAQRLQTGGLHSWPPSEPATTVACMSTDLLDSTRRPLRTKRRQLPSSLQCNRSVRHHFCYNLAES
eukprot:1346790-Amorphochlora_amoeboformis.AAC.1